MSKRGESRLTDLLPDFVAVVLDKVASLSALSLGATLIYFLYAIFSGFVRNYPTLAQAQQQKVLGNLEIASNVFVLAALLLAAYAILRLWEMEQLPVFLGIGGAALHFGSPIGLAHLLGDGPNAAGGVLQRSFTSVGQILLAAAIIRGIPLLIQQVQQGIAGMGDESATRRAGRKQNPGTLHPFSPCWRLPYCRPYIRNNCVRYRDRTTCWRKKSGCMCDDDIMTAALMGGESTSAGAREKLILEFLPGAGGKARAAVTKRLKCKNCFIYLEHQRIKHKYAAPLALPVVVALFWYYLKPIEALYQNLGLQAVAVLQRLAFSQFNAQPLLETFGNPVVKWMIFVGVGVFALTYLLRFLEYLFFKLKI